MSARERHPGRSDRIGYAELKARLEAVVEYLERVLALYAETIGREMFEATADVSEVSAEEIIARDAKEYQLMSGHTILIAQIEVVGKGLLEREDELLAAMRAERERRRLQLYALMIHRHPREGHRAARGGRHDGGRTVLRRTRARQRDRPTGGS